jgi:hypothetical protein
MSNQYGKNLSPIKCNVCEKEQARRFYSYNDREIGAKSGYKNTCKKCSRNIKAVEIRNRDWKYRSNEILYMNAKRRARDKNLEFNLTRDDIVIPDICPILGIELFREDKKNWHHAPSIDRIDNTKGYTKDNIMIVSRRANILKKDATLQELIMIGKFYEHFLLESKPTKMC